MNWRRGFFRLWLVLSAAWIGVACYSAVNHPIPQQTKRVNVQIFDKDFVFVVPINTTDEMIGSFIKNDLKKADSCFGENPDFLCQFKTNDVFMPVPEYIDWIGWAPWALIPPASLLLFGSTLVWVINGFRRA